MPLPGSDRDASYLGMGLCRFGLLGRHHRSATRAGPRLGRALEAEVAAMLQNGLMYRRGGDLRLHPRKRHGHRNRLRITRLVP